MKMTVGLDRISCQLLLVLAVMLLPGCLSDEIRSLENWHRSSTETSWRENREREQTQYRGVLESLRFEPQSRRVHLAFQFSERQGIARSHRTHYEWRELSGRRRNSSTGWYSSQPTEWQPWRPTAGQAVTLQVPADFRLVSADSATSAEGLVSMVLELKPSSLLFGPESSPEILGIITESLPGRLPGPAPVEREVIVRTHEAAGRHNIPLLDARPLLRFITATTAEAFAGDFQTLAIEVVDVNSRMGLDQTEVTLRGGPPRALLEQERLAFLAARCTTPATLEYARSHLPALPDYVDERSTVRRTSTHGVASFRIYQRRQVTYTAHTRRQNYHFFEGQVTVPVGENSLRIHMDEVGRRHRIEVLR